MLFVGSWLQNTSRFDRESRHPGIAPSRERQLHSTHGATGLFAQALQSACRKQEARLLLLLTEHVKSTRVLPPLFRWLLRDLRGLHKQYGSPLMLESLPRGAPW